MSELSDYKRIISGPAARYADEAIRRLSVENAALREALTRILIECDPDDPPWADWTAGATTVRDIALAALKGEAG